MLFDFTSNYDLMVLGAAATIISLTTNYILNIRSNNENITTKNDIKNDLKNETEELYRSLSTVNLNQPGDLAELYNVSQSG